MKAQKRTLTSKQQTLLFHSMRFYETIVDRSTDRSHVKSVLPGGVYHYDREGNFYFPPHKNYPSIEI